jgi:hypothetical protein
MKYVEENTDRSISLTSYQKYKKVTLNENTLNTWIDYFARSGFVDHYHKSIIKWKFSKEMFTDN